MNTKIKFRIFQSEDKFMAGLATVGFSRGTLLRDVIQPILTGAAYTGHTPRQTHL
jgi:hypothetical protein